MPVVPALPDVRFRVARAAATLRAGGIVAYPTEGVFGLGCDPLNRDAVERVLAIKRRPMHKGLILIAADFAQLAPFVAALGEAERRRAFATWPGAHTWVLPASAAAPHWVRGDHPGIAVRVTAHPLVVDLCRAFGGAIVSTSANLAGRPAAKTPLQARLRCGPSVDLVLAGATSGRSGPTPISDVRDGSPVRIG